MDKTSNFSESVVEEEDEVTLSSISFGMGLYLLSFLTFVGNAMVLHAIRTEKRLQTVSNMFIMSLALADLTVGVIVMPISSAYAITGDWEFGYVVCQFWLCVDYTASTASIFNLSILSLDRYWSITSPLRYLRKRTKKRALIMIALAWTGASMWLIPVLGWHHIIFGGQRQQPDHVCDTEFATNMTFKVVTSILNFYIPTICMVVLNVRIFLAIKRRSKDIDRLGAYTAAAGSSNCSNNLKEVHYSCDSLTDDQTRADLDQDEAVVANGPTTNTSYKISRHVCCHMSDEDGMNRSQPPTTSSSEFQRLAIVALHDHSRHEPKEPLRLYEGIVVKVEYQRSPSDEDEAMAVASESLNSKSTCTNCHCTRVGKKAFFQPRQSLAVSHRASSSCGNGCIKSSTTRCRRPRRPKEDLRHSRHIHCYRSAKRQMTSATSTDTDSVNLRQSGSFCSLRGCRDDSKKTSTAATPNGGDPNKRCRGWSVSDKEDRNQCSSDRDVDQTGNEIHHHGTSDRKRPFHSPFGSFFSGLWQRPGNRAGSGNPRDKDSGQATSSSQQPQRANPNLVLAKEKKAATQLGVIVGAFVLCWLPYFTLFMVVAYCGEDQCVNQTFFTTTVWFGYFNSTLNPFLYPLCNANFKRAFKRMLRIRRESPAAARTNESWPHQPITAEPTHQSRSNHQQPPYAKSS